MRESVHERACERLESLVLAIRGTTLTSNRTGADLAALATRLRLKTLGALYAAGSGHIGASLSMAELVAVLYFDEMTLEGEDRDRFVLSKGHAVPMLYAAFAELGWISEDELRSLRQLNSRLQGHPDMTRLPCLDAGTGALGQGASIAIGYALAARLRSSPARSYCILGDGETQEGQIWEAAMYASSAKLENLCLIIDANGLQNETWVADTLPIEPLADKWTSFGWRVSAIDGHDIDAIRVAFGEARETKERPTLILARTVKGKGVPFMENDSAWHGKQLQEAEYRAAVEALSA